jgi:hypothetical protein
MKCWNISFLLPLVPLSWAGFNSHALRISKLQLPFRYLATQFSLVSTCEKKNVSTRPLAIFFNYLVTCMLMLLTSLEMRTICLVWAHGFWPFLQGCFGPSKTLPLWNMTYWWLNLPHRGFSYQQVSTVCLSTKRGQFHEIIQIYKVNSRNIETKFKDTHMDKIVLYPVGFGKYFLRSCYLINLFK